MKTAAVTQQQARHRRRSVRRRTKRQRLLETRQREKSSFERWPEHQRAVRADGSLSEQHQTPAPTAGSETGAWAPSAAMCPRAGGSHHSRWGIKDIRTGNREVIWSYRERTLKNPVKLLRFHKRFQQDHRTQTQCSKINSIFIH